MWKTDEGKAGIIILLIFVPRECFNCRWVKNGGMGQKSRKVVHPFVTSDTKGDENAGWTQGSIFSISGVNQRTAEVGWAQDFLV